MRFKWPDPLFPSRSGEPIVRLSGCAVLAALFFLVFHIIPAGASQPATPGTQLPPGIIGSWDITVHSAGGDFPSWLEIRLSGNRTLVGRFVAAFGSARPIAQVFWHGDQFQFSLPVQWESLKKDQWMRGTVKEDSITGTTLAYTGKVLKFDGVRAPDLVRKKEPEWGDPIDLFDGTSLNGWIPRGPNSQWVVTNGALTNLKSGADIMTARKFMDFKLHAEFCCPRESNSGIYLRARYEVQIEDSWGLPPDSHHTGGIYGFLQPRVNAASKAGEWQTYDITLVGRIVTVTLNGETVINRQEIPDITGGALDSREGEPGPIFIQGDHGPVSFRNLKVTPAK